MSKNEVTREELELAVQSFEQMGGMAKYAQIMEQATSMIRDNFEAVERALRMVRTLHEKQLQTMDHWIDVCKFLLPLFATAAVAGLTITTTGFNGQIATIVGTIGFLVFFAGLFEQSNKRQKLLTKQEKNLKKLQQTFRQGQELVNTLKDQAQNERGGMTNSRLEDHLHKILHMMKKQR